MTVKRIISHAAKTKISRTVSSAWPKVKSARTIQVPPVCSVRQSDQTSDAGYLAARLSTSSSSAERSEAPNLSLSSASIAARSLPSTASFIATRRSAASSPLAGGGETGVSDQPGGSAGCSGFVSGSGSGSVGSLRLRDRLGGGRHQVPPSSSRARLAASIWARSVGLATLADALRLGFGLFPDAGRLRVGIPDDLGGAILRFGHYSANGIGRLGGQVPSQCPSELMSEA